ncbi:MAG TPA: phage portal protein, partial [Longimicrobiales bacterium]
PAADIIHWYQRDDRVDLTRGIPPMAVALRDLAHIADAQDASLIALKVNAANNGFITATGDNVEPEDPPEDDIYMDGEPGQYKILPRGYRVESPDPNQPQDNFPDFVRAVLRASAVGLGTSYAFLAADWSDANFASMRLGRADEQDEWIALQNDFIETVCQRVYERWLVSAVLSGALVLPQFDVSLASAVEWQGRRWVSPKPLEDVEVYERRVALGIDSRSEIMAAEGRDLWPTWDHLAEEQEYADELGILVEPPRKATTATATPLPERPGEGDDASGTSTTTGTTTSGGRLRFQFAASPNGHPNGRAAHSNGNGAAHD